MTTTDEPLNDKDCLDFIGLFDSMLLTCEKMKETIKRIQGSSTKNTSSNRTKDELCCSDEKKTLSDIV